MNPIDSAADPLFDIELKVARRADELSRVRAGEAKDAFALWCEAEREVLASPRFVVEESIGGRSTRASEP